MMFRSQTRDKKSKKYTFDPRYSILDARFYLTSNQYLASSIERVFGLRSLVFSRKNGFSLIELIIVIIILGICLTPIGLLFYNVMAKYSIPETMQVAVGLAEQRMEEVTALRFSDITSMVPTPFTGQFANYSYQVIVTAVPPGLANDPGMTKYKQIEVRVSHSLINPVSIVTVATKK